jgi:phosphotransferase system HPr-like phosphotransfer protein
MFSFSIHADNKNVLLELFETLSKFRQNILLKCGDIIVDAHSLIGVFSLELNKPIELIMEDEPDDSLVQAVSKFALAAA